MVLPYAGNRRKVSFVLTPRRWHGNDPAARGSGGRVRGNGLHPVNDPRAGTFRQLEVKTPPNEPEREHPRSGYDLPPISPDTPRNRVGKPAGAIWSAGASYTGPRPPASVQAAMPGQHRGFPLPDPASGATVEKFHYTGTSARNSVLPDVNQEGQSFSRRACQRLRDGIGFDHRSGTLVLTRY